jgi:cytochrome c556
MALAASYAISEGRDLIGCAGGPIIHCPVAELRREDMRRLLYAGLALATGIVTTAAFATDDPILTRKKLMQANGGAAGAMQAMIKGETPFSAAVAQSALRTFNAVAYSVGDYFPAGSDQGETRASPKIWEDMAGFQQILTNFQQATDAARQTEPQSVEDLQAAMGEIGKNCGGCHETYRLEQN